MTEGAGGSRNVLGSTGFSLCKPVFRPFQTIAQGLACRAGYLNRARMSAMCRVALCAPLGGSPVAR
ncbi:hypothetical protein WH216_15025, partial [Xanthomonas perforans]|uniref:hypothetical protein n=2 Tax=Xanthomonas TaxID=338 RepID=UPI00321AC401